MTIVHAYMDVVVRRRTEEAIDVVVLELADPDGRDLPPFSAGSHIDVEIIPGLVRQYSLSNSPVDHSRYEIAVLREAQSRGGSQALHDTVREGARLRISEPRNHFPLAVNARRSLLFAGGIGITPLLCMAERMHHGDGDFELHYSARTPERAAYLRRIAESGFADRVHLHFGSGDASQRLDLAACLAAPADDDHLYVCGPVAYMDKVLAAARAAGWAESGLHREYFVAPETDADAGPDRPFDVQLAHDGRRLHVPGDRTLAEVLADAGIEVPVSCSQGICGTCLTRIIEGEPEHRDFFLTADEQAANDCLTPCCSRAKSPLLVLDL